MASMVTLSARPSRIRLIESLTTLTAIPPQTVPRMNADKAAVPGVNLFLFASLYDPCAQRAQVNSTALDRNPHSRRLGRLLAACPPGLRALYAVQHWQRSVRFWGTGGARVDAQLGITFTAGAGGPTERALRAGAGPL